MIVEIVAEGSRGHCPVWSRSYGATARTTGIVRMCRDRDVRSAAGAALGINTRRSRIALRALVVGSAFTHRADLSDALWSLYTRGPAGGEIRIVWASADAPRGHPR